MTLDLLSRGGAPNPTRDRRECSKAAVADLFGTGAQVDPSLKSAALPRPKHTGAWVRDGNAVHFIHPCGICGAPDAPYGFGVNLRKAIAKRDMRLAGIWLCGPCREILGK